MKTNSITAEQMAARLATASPINPLFTECLNQLREVFTKISKECYATDGKLKEDYMTYYLEFEDHLNDAAMEIGEMARMDYIDRQYYSIPSQESEVCDA